MASGSSPGPASPSLPRGAAELDTRRESGRERAKERDDRSRAGSAERGGRPARLLAPLRFLAAAGGL